MPARKNHTKDFYNRHAEAWAREKTNSFFHEREFRVFRSYLKKGARVLDIGCASGIHVPLFLGIGRDLKYEGLDISTSFLKIAQRRYPQLSFREGDVTDTRTLPRAKYDGFWAAAVLMHVPEEHWPDMLANIERMMRPGAIGYITVPRDRFVDPKADPRHFSIFDKAKFRKVVGARGWRVLKSGGKVLTKNNEWLWFLVQLPEKR